MMTGEESWQILSTHRYPVRTLAGDYLRTLTGLFLTAGPLLWVDPVDILRVILFLLLAVFLVFGFRTMLRQATSVELCDRGNRTGGRFVPQKLVSWHHMNYLSLRYFSTRRDREAGWMQLRLGDGSGQLSLDSSLDGFKNIADRALRSAGENKISLESVTVENMQAMGLAPEYSRENHHEDAYRR